MSVNDSILKKSANWFRCIGYLSESNLKRESCDIKQKDANGQDAGTKKGERIMGSVAVKTDNGIHTFNVYAQSLTSKGEESKQWKMYCDMLNWNPQIGGTDEPPTLVSLEGAVSVNDYLDANGEIHSGLRWRVSRASTNRIDEEANGTSLKATLYIQNISPEVRTVGEEQEETGRLLVKMYGVDNRGACFPVTAFVNEDMAEDFEDCYEVGMTVPLEFDLLTRNVGNNKAETKKKFGHSSSVEVNQGFNITELIIVGGDNEIEEPDELTTEDENGNEVPVKTEWIDPKAMKAAIKERAVMLEEMKNGDSASTKKAKTTQRKLKEEKEKRFKKTPKKVEYDFTEDEDPFDSFDEEDEEDPF